MGMSRVAGASSSIPNLEYASTAVEQTSEEVRTGEGISHGERGGGAGGMRTDNLGFNESRVPMEG